MSNLPAWARKPKHKKTVVATKRGWVVEETGELLYSAKNLTDRLDKLFSSNNDGGKDTQEATQATVSDDEGATEPKPEPMTQEPLESATEANKEEGEAESKELESDDRVTTDKPKGKTRRSRRSSKK